jgi:type II secretory pathway component GspD/PulD (secretin)
MDRARRKRWMGAGVGIFLLFVVPLSALGAHVNGSACDGAIDFVAVDAEVTKLLFFFAEYGGLNIVVDGSVSGTVTVRLPHVAPAVAFEIVLELAQLEAHDVDGSLFITRKAR